MLSVVVLFSAFYVIAEAGHDCTGEDCPVCACIQLCERTLHQISSGITALFTVLTPVILLMFSVSCAACVISQETPVSKKVRLND